MVSYWDIVWQNEIGNYRSFFALLAPLPLKPQKSELCKNENNCWRYHHFTPVYQKLQSYEVRFLRCGVTHIIFHHFRPFFPFYPPNNLENQNFAKMKQGSGEVIILHMSRKVTITWCMLPEICWNSRWCFGGKCL